MSETRRPTDADWQSYRYYARATDRPDPFYVWFERKEKDPTVIRTRELLRKIRKGDL